MALTVGELSGIITIDDRTVAPALRRAEEAIRASGQRMGDDADRTGQQAGQQLGGGFVRGADGQWRNIGGGLVDAVTAAALDAESEAHRAGARIAAGLTDDLDSGLTTGARQAGDDAGGALGDGLGDGAADGADDAVGRAEGGLSKLKTAALGIGVAAGAVLMDGLGQAMEQQQITGRLGAQLGATGKDAQRYGHIAGQLYAGAVTEDFQTAADTIGAVMGSGLVDPTATNAQIQSIATKVSDLATTFDQDLGGVTNAVSQMIRTGLAKNAGEALDILTAGFQSSANKAGDLVDTFNEYGVQFKKAGLDGTTAVGLMNQAIQHGARDSDLAADAIKEFSIRAVDGSKTTSDGFKALGLNADDMAKKFGKGGKSASAALDTTLDKLRNIKDPIKQSAAATALFGTQAEDLGSALYAMDPSSAAAGLGKVGGAAKNLGDSVRDNAATEIEAFKRGAMQRLVDFLGGTVIPAFMSFYTFLSEHQTEVKTIALVITAVVVPALVALGVQAMIAGARMAAAWVAALGPIGWVGLAIGALVILVITYWDQIKGATAAAWGWIVSKVSGAKDGILAAISWLSAIPGMVSAWFGAAKDYAVGKMNALVGWLTGLPGKIGSAIGGMTSVLATRANAAWTSFKTASAQKATAFVGWVKGLPGRISSSMGSLAGLLVSKGRNVVQGLWNGIKGMGGWIKSKLISWAKSMIPGPIAKALGISSPSKVTKAQGRWIARGLVDGMTGSSKQVKSAAQKLADIVRDSLKPGKKRSKALGRISADAKKLTAMANTEARLAGRLKTASKKLADLIKGRDKLAADVKKGVLDSANITQGDNGGWPVTADSILAGLQQDRVAAEKFAHDLAELKKKGVRSDLISQIAQAGVTQGSSAAAALANASSSQIKQINREQGALVTAAGQAGTTAGDAMYGAGIHAAEGLVKGLKSKQKQIEAQMLAIAKGMSKAIKKALGIKSPSKVMAQVGAYTAEGLRQGIEAGRPAVNRSMASLVDTPAPGSWDSASARARAAASNRAVIELRSSGRGVDDFLVEAARRGVRKKGGGDVDLVFTGRRSG